VLSDAGVEDCVEYGHPWSFQGVTVESLLVKQLPHIQLWPHSNGRGSNCAADAGADGTFKVDRIGQVLSCTRGIVAWLVGVPQSGLPWATVAEV